MPVNQYFFSLKATKNRIDKLVLSKKLMALSTKKSKNINY